MRFRYLNSFTEPEGIFYNLRRMCLRSNYSFEGQSLYVFCLSFSLTLVLGFVVELD